MFILSFVINLFKKESLNRIQSSCITCLCHLFYWNKDLRQKYIFDIEFYRLIFKALLISYNLQSKQTDQDLSLFTNCQENLAIILFIFLYNQVSSIDYFNESMEMNSSTTKKNDKILQSQFDLSANLKNYIIEPFNISKSGFQHNFSNVFSSNACEGSSENFEIKQKFQSYELNCRLKAMLKKKLGIESNQKYEMNLKETLDKKFRLYWNINWHGGSLVKLCNDILVNPQMVQNKNSMQNFRYCLNFSIE